MLYIIGLIITIFKGILFILGKDLLPYLSERNIGFILGIIMVKELIKYFPEEEQKSMWHNFERFGVPLVKEK